MKMCEKNRLATSMRLTVSTAHRTKEVYEFAYTYPYSYTELQRWLLGLERSSAPYLQRGLLCRTAQLKRVDMLVIEDLPSQVGMVQQVLLACTGIVHFL